MNKLLRVAQYLLMGFLCTGAILDTISNSISLFTFRSATIFSISVGVVWLMCEFYVRKKGFRYEYSDKSIVRIKKINFGSRAVIIGILITPWMIVGVKTEDDIMLENGSSYLSKYIMNDASSLQVGVLPFREMCLNIPNKDIGQEIFERITGFARENNLKIETNYLNQIDVDHFTRDSVNKIISKLNYDLIIYGNYYDSKCTSNSDEICYNWVATDKIIPNDLMTISEVETNKYIKVSLDELRNGKAQSTTDFILNRVGYLSSINSGDFSSAISYCKVVLNELGYESEEALRVISSALSNAGKLIEALIYFRRLEKVIDKEDFCEVFSVNLAMADIYYGIGNRDSLRTRLELIDLNKEGIECPYYSLEKSTYYYFKSIMCISSQDSVNFVENAVKAFKICEKYFTDHHNRTSFNTLQDIMFTNQSRQLLLNSGLILTKYCSIDDLNKLDGFNYYGIPTFKIALNYGDVCHRDVYILFSKLAKSQVSDEMYMALCKWIDYYEKQYTNCANYNKDYLHYISSLNSVCQQYN